MRCFGIPDVVAFINWINYYAKMIFDENSSTILVLIFTIIFCNWTNNFKTHLSELVNICLTPFECYFRLLWIWFLTVDEIWVIIVDKCERQISNFGVPFMRQNWTRWKIDLSGKFQISVLLSSRKSGWDMGDNSW